MRPITFSAAGPSTGIPGPIIASAGPKRHANLRHNPDGSISPVNPEPEPEPEPTPLSTPVPPTVATDDDIAAAIAAHVAEYHSDIPAEAQAEAETALAEDRASHDPE